MENLYLSVLNRHLNPLQRKNDGRFQRIRGSSEVKNTHQNEDAFVENKHQNTVRGNGREINRGLRQGQACL